MNSASHVLCTAAAAAAALQTIEEQFKGTFDFFYLPIDFKNKCNVGYAFINMLMPQYIPPLVARFNNKRWDKFNSEKVRRHLNPEASLHAAFHQQLRSMRH
jgi:hypothetical protein